MVVSTQGGTSVVLGGGIVGLACTRAALTQLQEAVARVALLKAGLGLCSSGTGAGQGCKRIKLPCTLHQPTQRGPSDPSAVTLCCGCLQLQAAQAHGHMLWIRGPAWSC
jgi:hypothetical protein